MNETIKEVIKDMNNGICLCSGIDESNNSKWWLYGLPGEIGKEDIYYTIEIDMFTEGQAIPYINLCDKQAALVLYDEAWVHNAETLDVRRAIKELRDEL